MLETHAGIHWVHLDSASRRRLAMTDGLHERDHPEVGVVVDWPRDRSRDAWVAQALHRIMRYVERTDRVLKPGQTMQVAWLPFRFAGPPEDVALIPQDTLLLEEAATPHDDPDNGFMPGVRRTVDILQAQQAVLDRHDLSEQGEHPQPHEFAVVCLRLMREPETHRTLQAVRSVEGRRPDDSRWHIGCSAADHDHDDPANWSHAHIRHLVRNYPVILQYLALPGDSAFNIWKTHIEVFRPGEQQARIEPVEALTWLP